METGGGMLLNDEYPFVFLVYGAARLWSFVEAPLAVVFAQACHWLGSTIAYRGGMWLAVFYGVETPTTREEALPTLPYPEPAPPPEGSDPRFCRMSLTEFLRYCCSAQRSENWQEKFDGGFSLERRS